MTEPDIEAPRLHRASESLFDWQHDIERLTRQTRAAMTNRRSDEWALAEAQCTLDLIMAELLAARCDRKADAEAALSTVARLEIWRAQVEGLIQDLQSLPK